MPKSRKRKRRSKVRRNPLALERMFEQVVENAHTVPAPRVLYHYTTMAGAEGILSSQRFWASAHDCMNDEAELKSADLIIKEVANGLRKTATGTAVTVLDLFLDRYSTLQITQVMNVCLACFSLARDDQEQWRKYGDDGRGVCLGIRMLNEPGPEKYPSRLIQVDYSESSWRDKVRENFAPVCSMLARADDSKRNCELGVSALSRIAAFASIMAKRADWAGEQEFRYVTLIDQNTRSHVKERESDGKTIRYLPVPVRAEEKRISLDEIIIGPNQNHESARERLIMLLETAGYRTIDAEYPTIPLSAVPKHA